MRLLKKDIVVNTISFYFVLYSRMEYPQPTTTKAYIEYKDDVYALKIPQATIGQVLSIQKMDTNEYATWLALSLVEWGLPQKKVMKMLEDASFQKDIVKLLAETFFKKREFEPIPQSVAELATKRKHEYTTPESIIFYTMAKNYHISPRELLDYTFDEVNFLMRDLQYVNLNEDQEAELARVQRVKNFDKAEIEKNLENLA